MKIKACNVFKIDGEALYSAMTRASGTEKTRLEKFYKFFVDVKDKDYGSLSEKQLDFLETIQNEFCKL